MAVSDLTITDKGLVQTTHGTIFIADASSGEVALPTKLNDFALLAKTVDSKWYNMGHTSADSKLDISFDGGEAESKSTWLVSNARTSYSNTTMKITGKSVQGDKNTVKFIYNGWDAPNNKGISVSVDKTAQKVSVLILAQDEGANLKFGMYLPNVDLTYTGAPDFSSENFVEYGFNMNVLGSTSALPQSSTGKTASYAIITPEDFTD